MKKGLRNFMFTLAACGVISLWSCRQDRHDPSLTAESWTIGASNRTVERNYHESGACTYKFTFSSYSLCPAYRVNGKITVNGTDVFSKTYPDTTLLSPAPDQVILNIPADADVKVRTEFFAVTPPPLVLCVWPGEAGFELKRE